MRISKVIIGIVKAGHTGVDPVQIVEIRSETESLNGAFDVLLNVRSRVGDRTIPSDDVEATFRSDCREYCLARNHSCK